MPLMEYAQPQQPPHQQFMSTSSTVEMGSNSIDAATKHDFHRIDSTATTTNSCSSSLNEYTEKGWLEDPGAWNHFCSVLTALYGLFVIVFAVLVELSQKFTPEEWISETLFFGYMYGVGSLFLLHCYLFKINPHWVNALLRIAHKRQWIRGMGDWYISKTRHTGEGAGSLYLRLGTLCFGSSGEYSINSFGQRSALIIGVVLFCLEIFMCLSNERCYNYQLLNWLFACAFTFVQMHFLFCNSKIVIVNSKNMTRLGLMHLLSVNVWVWVRFVIAKNAALERPALGRFQLPSPPPQKGELIIIGGVGGNDTLLSNATIFSDLSLPLPPSPHTIASFNYFGAFATLLTTSIVEFSVISAAMMLVLWRSVDVGCSSTSTSASSPNNAHCLKRKHKVLIDCSASAGGLFAGLLFLIGSLVSIGIHEFFSQHCDSQGALLVFRLSDEALFCFALIGCSMGLYRMRFLQYHKQRCSSAELLDEILLVVGLVGELIHSSTGVMCWISTQSERETPNKMEFYMLFVFLTRIIEVVVQAVFILLARRLRALSPLAMETKPGKQYVTFLLIANVSLFFFHTLEGMKSVFGSGMGSGRTRPYAALISGVAPLVVFYRFHSSVCLAEIWKHAFSVKRKPAAPTEINNTQ